MTHRDWSSSTLKREAAAWLVRLDDDPGSAALCAQLEEWIARSPAHKASWDEALDMSALIEGALLPHADDVLAEPVASANVIAIAPHRRLLELSRRSWRLAGALAVAACAPILIVPDAAVRLRADAVTGTGELRAISFSDGSRAVLAPGSALAFDSDAKSRTVHLIRGRAFFDVAHDPQRPFRVDAGEAAVTVLGTAFEVDLVPDGARVAVGRGLVEVRYPRHGIRDRLRPGDAISLQWRGGAQHEQVRFDRVAGWTEGKLYVKNRPIGAVLEELRPWYSGYLFIRGRGTEERRVTGLFDLRNPDAAIDALAKAHPLSVQQLTPWVKIVTVN